MKLRTEVNVSLRHYQNPVKYSIFTAILVFLPEILFFIGGNVAIYHDTFAKYFENIFVEATEATDGDLIDNDTDWLEATGSEASTSESGDASFGLGDKVYIFGDDSVSFWGNVTNNDSNKINENGVVIFYGEKWTNSASGNLNSEGLLCLTSPRPYPYNASFAQEVDNGGRSASFPDVVVDNPNNVYMMNDMIVNDTLYFLRGKLVLDGHNLIINNSHPDAIQGYNEDRYVVTGEGATGGYLIRKGVGKKDIDFPIGTDTNSYTPLRMSNNGTVDDYSVRVFGGVFENGDSGVDYSTDGVGKTWDVQEANDGGSDLTLEMQHNSSEEGSAFAPALHFITRYTGVKNNTEGDTISGSEWDLLSKSNSGSGSTSGYITSGASISGAIVSTRSGITKTGLFTKASWGANGVLPVELLYFTAKAEDSYNLLKWSTSMEIDNYYFTVERSIDGENYETLDRIPGAGNTTEIMEYKYEDVQPFDVTYYRLRQTDYDGKEEIIGNAVVRRDEMKTQELLIYPNPCRGEYLYVELPRNVDGNSSVQILDLSGNIMKKIDIDPFEQNETLKIREDYLPRGMYIVQYANANLMRTKKLVIPER